jgi:hypothetical protein
MRKYQIILFLFSIVAVLTFNACYKEPNFSLTPEISFNKIEKFIRLDQFSGAKKDSIILTVNFKDGDGDLGYNSDEIGKKVSQTDYNYVVKSSRKIKGKLTEFKPSETFSGFYPKLKTDDKIGPIEGKLSYRIQIETAFWPVKKDTLVFEIYIKDRAGNKSNSISTEPLVINTL